MSNNNSNNRRNKRKARRGDDGVERIEVHKDYLFSDNSNKSNKSNKKNKKKNQPQTILSSSQLTQNSGLSVEFDDNTRTACNTTTLSQTERYSRALTATHGPASSLQSTDAPITPWGRKAEGRKNRDKGAQVIPKLNNSMSLASVHSRGLMKLGQQNLKKGGSKKAATNHAKKNPGIINDGEREIIAARIACSNLSPFAIISEVKSSSPSEEDGMDKGDLLLKFGSTTADNSQCGFAAIRKAIVEQISLAAKKGGGISIAVRREEHICFIDLKPRKWDGHGLVGCVLNEYIPKAVKSESVQRSLGDSLVCVKDYVETQLSNVETGMKKEEEKRKTFKNIYKKLKGVNGKDTKRILVTFDGDKIKKCLRGVLSLLGIKDVSDSSVTEEACVNALVAATQPGLGDLPMKIAKKVLEKPSKCSNVRVKIRRSNNYCKMCYRKQDGARVKYCLPN